MADKEANILSDNQKLGVAVIGVGKLTIEEILPALRCCRFAKLAALVTSDVEEVRDLARQYNLPDDCLYTYDEFERLKDDDDVKIVYIVLPNAMHREYTERAAKIGKHVLCEKPMANTIEDCQAMIAACEAAKVKLMIAYRCQYEPFNIELIKRAHDGRLGGIRVIEACNSQMETNPDQWRLDADLAGGGALPDIGLYCLNAARYVSKEEPVEVFGWKHQPKDDERFKEVEARLSFVMRFPSGVVAQCFTAYDGYDTKKLSVRLEKGWMELYGAFSYGGKELLVKSDNENGVPVVQSIQLEAENQFALEIDHMAECVLNDKEPRTGGAEGLKDQIIMDAIYRSVDEGAPVRIDYTVSGNSTVMMPDSKSTPKTKSSVNGR